jgi:hypothetical protein
MSNADWYARRLGGQAPAAPRQNYVPPQAPQQAQPQHRPMSVSPTQTTYQQVQQDLSGIPLNEGERQSLLNPDLPPTAEIGFGEALRRWRGGIAHRTEGNQFCPACGSSHVSHRAAGSIGGNTPAPHCFGCGWNGKFQQGDQSNWAA